MDVRFAYKHLETSDALNDFARKKSEKIMKFLHGRNHHIDWNFSVEKKQNHIAHCHVTADHLDVFAEASTTSMYNSIEEVIDHIEKQLQKEKEIVIDKHKHRITT